jgi:hypothetical protein
MLVNAQAPTLVHVRVVIHKSTAKCGAQGQVSVPVSKDGGDLPALYVMEVRESTTDISSSNSWVR